MSEFKYVWFVLVESRTDGVKCRRKVLSEKKIAGVIRSLENARSL